MKGPKRTLDEYCGTVSLIVALLDRVAWLTRHSRLLRPEELLLKADRAEHLVGRSEDVDRLSKLCTDYQQVHLVGESGAGKSALVKAGLYPELRIHARLIPIYVDIWGQDWETGPRIALASALCEALTEEERDTLKFTGSAKLDNLIVSIRQVAMKLGRMPLLIFDQFDDYQIRFLSQFLPGRRRTWLPTEKLIEVNSFWRDIKELVDNESAHCLFITRNDTADGLESIRFVCPQVYRLDRLNVDSVQPLLTSLTHSTEGSDAIVFEPDRGWERLKDRLAHDLGKDGAVLPAQMKIALQGLASLRALTIRSYVRKGSLRGLEAAHIERHIVGAARNFNLSKSQVRTLLVSLVDPEVLKTIPKTTDELREAVMTEHKRDSRGLEQTVQATLDFLERREIIRKRRDLDTRRHVWLLDHDYLCRGVLEAEQKADRWFVMAQESHRAFQEAGSSIWRKWKSLLDPWQQIKLVCLRLVGRFRYGSMRSFAALSLFRFVPFLILGSAIVFYFIQAEEQLRKRLDQAYATIHSAEGKPGDLGRKDALQFLHKTGKSLARLNLSRADLRGLSLPGADLIEVNLAGTMLTEANFSRAKLDRANLSGADLNNSDLTGASIRKATISKAVLSNANLTNKADLTGANLQGAILWKTNLSDAILIDANLVDAGFAEAILPRAVLVDTMCTGADFTMADLSEANLMRAHLVGAELTEASLVEADLTGANLTDTNLVGVNLSKADLTDANLPRARLWSKANLTGAILTRANLTDANLHNANLARANLDGANLSGAYLSEANLTDIREWQKIKSAEYVNIYNVKNAPKGFKDWAKAPEQHAESYEKWRDWKYQKMQEVAKSGK